MAFNQWSSVGFKLEANAHKSVQASQSNLNRMGNCNALVVANMVT